MHVVESRAESRAWFDKYNYRDSLQARAIEEIGYCVIAKKSKFSIPSSQIQSETKVLGDLTNLKKNWHCTDLPIPTPNSMLVSIHHTVGQYLNIVFGG